VAGIYTQWRNDPPLKEKENRKMNDTQKTDAVGSAEERAARIERMATAIIDDAKQRTTERHRRNDAEMEKLKRWLASKPRTTPSGSQSDGRAK
jgi:hypothetical protein